MIGVYEPLVHVVGAVARRTSRAADPDLARAEPGSCYHLDCTGLADAGIVVE